MSSTPDTIRIKDQSLDSALRPSVWDDYVGQGHVKSNIKVLLSAAKKRGGQLAFDTEWTKDRIEENR
ncbi:MAG: hypothetical protein AAB901_02145, partial [Patescibacteria group bacterium]